ncbi:MAG: limonene-1,2-epoxide hydrolase family protein [Pseudomonadales bacterium]|jgi:limonene-1,2-epoxide hydrolase
MSNTQAVRDFCSAWERRDLDGIVNAVSEDCHYENIGYPPIVGREAIREFVQGFVQGATDVTWEIRHIAETADGTVLTERVDAFTIGGNEVSVAVMGAFEFRDGLICAWRDYFDTKGTDLG